MRREWTCHPASSPLNLSGEQPVPSELSPHMSDRPYAAFCRCMCACENEHLKISLVCVFGICKDYTLRLFMQSVLKECITIMMYGNIFFPYSNVSSHKRFTYIYIIYRYTFGKPLVGAKVEVTAKFKYYWEKTPQPNISLNGTVSKHFFVCKISHLWSLRSDFHPFFLHWHWHNNSPSLCFVLAFILTAGFQRRVSIYLQHQRSCRACE